MAEPEPHDLIRLDDNGNQFRVGTFPSRAAAEEKLAQLAAGGHKQTYWVEASPRNVDSAPAAQDP